MVAQPKTILRQRIVGLRFDQALVSSLLGLAFLWVVGATWGFERATFAATRGLSLVFLVIAAFFGLMISKILLEFKEKTPIKSLVFVMGMMIGMAFFVHLILPTSGMAQSIAPMLVSFSLV